MRALYLRYLRNDLSRNRGVMFALLAVLVLSAFLMASGALVMERLGGSVGRLFEMARPPHFLQMHQGEFDRDALEAFAAEHPEIEDWLVEEMVGFDGQEMTWEKSATGERGDFSESLIDNLVVAQNDGFDLLLDAHDVAVTPEPGEINIPVSYAQGLGLQAGDRLAIETATGMSEFEIAGFVRDAQMASSLSSATRFLVSQQDFDAIGGLAGNSEIIVEYRLQDPSMIDEFQRAYDANPGVPKNGQAVTETMIRLVNMLSDGLVAVAFMFGSLLLIVIALLNVRFMMRGTIEDEIHEIGAMKAIGLPHRTITTLYLLRYGVMALLACVIGGALAAAASGALTAGMRANFAVAPVTVLTFVVPALALAALFLLVAGLSGRVLRAVKRVGVVDALVQGRTSPSRRRRGGAPRKGSAARSQLRSAYAAGLNRRLTLVDLYAERSQWVLVPAVFFLVALLMALPMNLLSTFESPRFVTYMGAPESDLRADVQFVNPTDGTATDVTARLTRALEADPRVSAVSSFATVLAETPGENGWETLRVQVGDHSDSTLVFLAGESPGDGQIALSVLNAEKLAVSPGDQIELRRDDVESRVQVSGVYQDVTSGGFTAKMSGEAPSNAVRWTVFADLAGGGDPQAMSSALEAGHPAATIIPMREYVQQTLSYVTDMLRSVVVVMALFGLGAAGLIATLFVRLRVGKDRRKMGVLAAVGFSGGEIAGQLRTKMLLCVASGAVLGTVFSATLGESLVGALLSTLGLGLAKLSFIPQPWVVYVLFPALLIFAGVAGAYFLTRGMRSADRSRWLR